MREKSATNEPDQAIATLATRQHGVVTLTQLAQAGIDKSAVTRRVRSGLLHRIHRGVYAVGHRALSNHGRWLAAVLACGPGAVLSHRSAAELWELLRPRSGPVHVTVPGAGGRKRRRGIVIHRSPSLPSAATTRRDGISVTTPARTIRDLARCAPEGLVRAAVREAEFRSLDLGDRGGDGTFSELEAIFLRFLRRRRLPRPEVNVAIGPYQVDFLWRRHRVVVETDGWTAHRGRQAFEDDRERDLYLHSRGITVRRFTKRQLLTRGDEVAAELRALLR